MLFPPRLTFLLIALALYFFPYRGLVVSIDLLITKNTPPIRATEQSINY